MFALYQSLAQCLCVDVSCVCLSFQEVRRIRYAHPDDAFAVINGRVKGSLKVTRAFGAGFLKQVHLFLSFELHYNLDYVKSLRS